ncbi:hypothetical protein PRBRB14_20020 [Hallella multisaccharivorax DSM 17128]|nr:hypothetical protein PRBRB14_20020 [Hallella multisaccharivorax DSM 17128]
MGHFFREGTGPSPALVSLKKNEYEENNDIVLGDVDIKPHRYSRQSRETAHPAAGEDREQRHHDWASG